MMQPQELRMGNLVYNRHNEVTEVDVYDLKHMCQPRMDGHGYSGIPLTAEWLEKMGFVADGVEGIYVAYEQDGVKICHDVHKNSFLVDNIKTLKVAPRYLHELQNVMFALSGREPEVKP